MGQRDAVARASQVREPLAWPSARALGVDHPCLARERGEPRGEAGGGAAPGRRLRKAQGLVVVGLVEGREARGAADRAQGPHWEAETGMGGHPVGAVLGQRASGDEAVEVAVGIERLVPGGQHQRRAALAAQVGLATWSRVWLTVRNSRVSRRRLCPSMSAWRACGTVNTGWQEGGGATPHAALHPLDCGPCLTLWDRGDSGTRSRHSAQSRTADTVPPAPEWRGATGEDGVDALLLGRRDRMGGCRRWRRRGGRGRRRPTVDGRDLAGSLRHGAAHSGRPGPPPAAAGLIFRNTLQIARAAALGPVLPGEVESVWSCRGRWPSRSWIVCRSTPASKRWVTKQGRRVWRPLPWRLPAARLAW